VIAILGGVAGLAVQFVPGIGIDRPPAPEALMHVREVHARITHGEYTDKTVGYPEQGRFQAQFRLIEAGQVRQTAATGAMRGSQQRYVC
jgi:hypothetical protein